MGYGGWVMDNLHIQNPNMGYDGILVYFTVFFKYGLLWDKVGLKSKTHNPSPSHI